MNPRIKHYVLPALMSLFIFAPACNLNDETEKANQMIDEGNQLVEEGNRLAEEAGTKNERLESGSADEKFAETQAKLKQTAQEAVDGFAKSAGKYREAAQKFDDASKLKVDASFKEYLSFKAQEFRKNAEGAEVNQSSARAFMESADEAAYLQKGGELKLRLAQLIKEAADFQQKAEKIRSDNREKFRS